MLLAWENAYRHAGVHCMEYEKSCGAVIYTNINDTVHYVLAQQLTGFEEFPKGHVEQNETEEQSALREIHEEALEMLGYDSSKRVLREVHEFIMNK